MPGKPEAHALAEEHDEISRRLGVANTLLRRADGGWRAENHDVHGIAQTLREHGAQAPATGGVLGSGATALSALAALLSLGARTVLLTARSPEKLAPLQELAGEVGARTILVPWTAHHEVLEADAVVSALAVAGARDVTARWEARGAERLPRPCVLLDVLYDPWPAPVAAVVRRAGGEVADGLEMLAHQADMQVRSMLQVPSAPVETMSSAARAELVRRRGHPRASEAAARGGAPGGTAARTTLVRRGKGRVKCAESLGTARVPHQQEGTDGMELQHDGPRHVTTTESSPIPQSPTLADDLPDAEPSALIPPDRTTAALRRCTALATRARADLLTHGRREAAAELAALLEEIADWSPEGLVDPDPTMTVLAAAALQDLAARLPVPAPSGLDARIDEVVRLLGGVMDRGHVGAWA